MTPGAGPVGERAAFVVLAGGESRRMGRDKAFLRVGEREMLDRLLEVGRSACSACVLAGGQADAHADALRRYGWDEVSAPAAGPGPRSPGGGPSTPDVRPAGPARRFRRGGVELRLVTDRRPGRGPVAGLEAGLEAAPAPLCFVAACDLPFLSVPVVTAVLRELDALRPAPEGTASPTAEAHDARAVVPVADGRRQPLAAAYTAGCAAAARRCVEAEELSMESLLGRLDEVRPAEARDLIAGGSEERAAGRALPSPFMNVNRPEDLRTARRGVRTRRTAGREDP